MSETTPSITVPVVPPGTWVIDAAHTVVGFAARHLMSRVRGTFSEVSGRLVTAEDPAGSSVTATVGMASINTGNQMRDDHLRSADFFDVERMPTMTFAGTGVRENGEGWILTGDLTIKGVTRPVDLDVEFLGLDPTGAQGEPRVGFSATTVINRRDFGVTWGLDAPKLVVGDKIDITLDVEAYRAE